MIYEKIRDVKDPVRAHLDDSGLDFFIPNDLKYSEDGTMLPVAMDGGYVVLIKPLERVLIPLGIKIWLPRGMDMQFVDKSGIATKQGLHILGGLIDCNYSGELSVCVVNVSNTEVELKPGTKIVQGVIRSVIYEPTIEGTVSENTDRGSAGFGSTGLT